MTKGLAGWARMWAVIAAKYGDAACHNEATNEVWQYLGTYNGVHQFRHRSLPACDGQRVYFNIEVLPGDAAPEAAMTGETVVS